MDFTKRKLPKEASERLRRVMISDFKPYEVLFSPAYVFLRSNEKFVAVKGPLDFFTPEELQKYASLEMIFEDPFVDYVKSYQDAGRGIRLILNWKNALPETIVKASDLGPSPFEISDAILRRVGPLWFEAMKIEPYFVTALACAVCDPMSEKYLTQARDLSIERFERGLIYSGVAVFFALLAGYGDLPFLNRVRDEIMTGEVFEQHQYSESVRPVLVLTRRFFQVSLFQKFEASTLDSIKTPLSEKIFSRLKRIENQFMSRTKEIPTLYGEKGLIHV